MNVLPILQKYYVSSYDQYKSPTFDVNKDIGQDHNTVYVKFTPSGSADKFTIRVF